MGSSFFGLNVSSQGLFAAQMALDITNHNISNAETPGYSRQYAVQKASRPLPNSFRGMVGTGAEVVGVEQHRSSYLDKKYWYMSTDLGQFTVKDEMMSQLELLFNEPSDNGYNAYFGDMFESLQKLSINPGDDATRSNFIDSAESFAAYFNNIGKHLADYQKEANFGVKVTVDEINFIASQLSSVNNQIENIELYADRANDLRDERALLVDKLSGLINIEAKELTDVNGKKSFKVSINGQTLVSGNTANYLKVVPRATLDNAEDQLDLYDIYWETGQKLYLNNDTSSGKLKGYLDIRDGNNGENFKGNISNIDGTGSIITVNNISKHDIPASGEIYLNNQAFSYTISGYDNVANTVEFNIAPDTYLGAVGDKVEIGEDVDFKGIPYYTKQLNEFVRTVAKAFNKIHKEGENDTGEELFSFKGYAGGLDENNNFTYDQININNFSFSENIVEDNSLLLTTDIEGAGESANDLILDLLDIKYDSHLFDKGEPDSFMQSLISEVGIDAKQVNSFKSGQENLTRLIENQRRSVSGVDLNEETTDMIRFQQAYNLSAKMISVMDEIYNVTINQLVR